MATRPIFPPLHSVTKKPIIVSTMEASMINETLL